MSQQLSLFDQPAAPSDALLDAADWPSPERFPLNRAGASVRRQVFRDLAASRTPLIVAGYASLATLVEFVANAPERVERIRLLIGSEPTRGSLDRPNQRVRPVPEEAREYWLRHNFSILQCHNLVRTIEIVKQGRVEARVLESTRKRLHAKIFLADDAVTLGSSNFTSPGLEYQWEANVRFSSHEPSRYREARAIAENYWSAGRDATSDLLAILESLLRVVTWQEALARASLELLEGEWARGYLARHAMPGDVELWPSQVAGIAQALWVIETTGSVLVADATGAGKTRMGAHLLRALADRSWRAGRVRSAYTLLVGPPSVEPTWEREATHAGAALLFRSHGQLSRQSSEDHALRVDEIRRAQVLAIDEAHNFLNPTSNRTRILLGNLADHAVLFTATPINRGATDLLRLADMLGADNLAPTTVKAFERFLGARRITRTLTPQEIDTLKNELRRFTVRRTKRELNAWVDRNPDAYRDAVGRCCRYPTHRTQTYELHEPAGDRAIAAEIDHIARGLCGMAYLRRPLECPDRLRLEGWSEELWLNARLKSAARLSAYQVRATLRSSACALVEHLAGTRQAIQDFGLVPTDKRTITGDVRSTLETIRGLLPGNRLTSAVPPTWLTDADEHARACDEDRDRYNAILSAVRQLSSARDDAKLDLIDRMTRDHDRVVAFDSRPITLALYASRLRARPSDVQTIVATGERAGARREAMRILSPETAPTRVALLASDALSEGINLQGASVVIHLDMPSVVRIAEQRVGRVDRMDSPHTAIEVYWPQDAAEFALRTDEKFIERYETVETLLGSNLPLPDALTGSRSEVVTPEQIATEAEDAETSWDGIEDAFAPVRALVTGESSLLPAELLDQYRGVSNRILSRVSLLRAEERWAFFCLAGTDTHAPRWLYVKPGARVETRLEVISGHLRGHLERGPDSLPLNPGAVAWLSEALTEVQHDLPRLLPRRKHVALDEMAKVLSGYHAQAAAANSEFVEPLRRLAETVKARETDLDWDAMANTWLEIVRPVWYARLTSRRRTARPVLLRDIRNDLIASPPMPYFELLRHFDDLPTLPPLESRVAACIVGLTV
jgi:hypothetical protein